MPKSEMRGLVEASKKELDSDLEKFERSVQESLDALRKKTLEKV